MAPSWTSGVWTLLAALTLISCNIFTWCEASRTSGTTTSGERDQEQGPSSLERVKRGWVWNQFFVVEEYTGTEPLYVGKVRHYDSLHKYMKNLVNRCQFLELLVVKRKRKECLSMQLRYG